VGGRGRGDLSSNGDVRLVELGGGRRRWWLVAAGLVVVWIVAASLVGGAGDDAATPTTGPAASTSSTALVLEPVPGGPLLGAPSGLHLVAPSRTGTVRVLDLDSGSVTRVALDGTPLAVRGDGVVTRTLDGDVVWRPFPFEDDTAVLLQTGGGGAVAFLASGDDLVWLAASERERTVMHLFRLEDGRLEASVELPPAALPVAAVGTSLLVTGEAGGGVLVAPDGSTRAVGSVLAGVGTSSWYPVGATHPDGRLLVSLQVDGDAREELVLLGPDGPAPVLPPDLAVLTTPAFATTAWTPDGSLLLIAFAGRLRVVDPFAEGGPVEVGSFPFAVATFLPLAVVAADSGSPG